MAFDDGSMVVAAHISMGMRQSIAMVTVMIVSPWYAQFPYICPAYGETYDGSLWATILMEWGKLWNVFPPQMCNQYFLYKCSISAHHNISSANAKLAIRKIWWVTQFITRFWHNHDENMNSVASLEKSNGNTKIIQRKRETHRAPGIEGSWFVPLQRQIRRRRAGWWTGVLGVLRKNKMIICISYILYIVYFCIWWWNIRDG